MAKMNLNLVLHSVKTTVNVAKKDSIAGNLAPLPIPMAILSQERHSSPNLEHQPPQGNTYMGFSQRAGRLAGSSGFLRAYDSRSLRCSPSCRRSTLTTMSTSRTSKRLKVCWYSDSFTGKVVSKPFSWHRFTFDRDYLSHDRCDATSKTDEQMLAFKTTWILNIGK
jgi:hypothetical protein